MWNYLKICCFKNRHVIHKFCYNFKEKITITTFCCMWQVSKIGHETFWREDFFKVRNILQAATGQRKLVLFCLSLRFRQVQVFWKLWKGHKKFEYVISHLFRPYLLSKRQNKWDFFSNFVAFSQYLRFMYYANGFLKLKSNICITKTRLVEPLCINKSPTVNEIFILKYLQSRDSTCIKW